MLRLNHPVTLVCIIIGLLSPGSESYANPIEWQFSAPSNLLHSESKVSGTLSVSKSAAGVPVKSWPDVQATLHPNGRGEVALPLAIETELVSILESSLNARVRIEFSDGTIAEIVQPGSAPTALAIPIDNITVAIGENQYLELIPSAKLPGLPGPKGDVGIPGPEGLAGKSKAMRFSCTVISTVLGKTATVISSTNVVTPSDTFKLDPFDPAGTGNTEDPWGVVCRNGWQAMSCTAQNLRNPGAIPGKERSGDLNHVSLTANGVVTESGCKSDDEEANNNPDATISVTCCKVETVP